MKLKMSLKSLCWSALLAGLTLIILFIIGEFAVDYIDPVSNSPIVGTPPRPWWANGIPFTYLVKSGDCTSGCVRNMLPAHLLGNLVILTVAYGFLIALAKRVFKK